MCIHRTQAGQISLPPDCISLKCGRGVLHLHDTPAQTSAKALISDGAIYHMELYHDPTNSSGQSAVRTISPSSPSSSKAEIDPAIDGYLFLFPSCHGMGTPCQGKQQVLGADTFSFPLALCSIIPRKTHRRQEWGSVRGRNRLLVAWFFLI